jgi:rhodanese-related sulfurtransferase
MLKVRLITIWLLAIGLLIGGCQSNASALNAAQGLTITPTPAETGNYWGLVKEAQDAYAEANFGSAMDLARQAITTNPQDNTAWEIYNQAAIAQAGDSYLNGLPEQRYQLPIAIFVRDRVNESRSWFIVDVREADEYAAGHIDGAINIPLHKIVKNLDKFPNSKSAPILLYCHSQKRATHALVILHELGYLKVFNLEGGYAAYEDWMNNNPLPTPGPTPTPGPDEPDLGC